MEALKRDLRVLLIGVLGLLLLIFVIGFGKVILIGLIVVVLYILLRLNGKSSKQSESETT